MFAVFPWITQTILSHGWLAKSSSIFFDNSMRGWRGKEKRQWYSWTIARHTRILSQFLYQTSKSNSFPRIRPRSCSHATWESLKISNVIIGNWLCAEYWTTLMRGDYLNVDRDLVTSQEETEETILSLYRGCTVVPKWKISKGKNWMKKRVRYTKVIIDQYVKKNPQRKKENPRR